MRLVKYLRQNVSKTSKYNKDTPEDNINAHEGGDINLIFELFGKN